MHSILKLLLFTFYSRFIWNFFRLENEHLNNCGEFRAVRDIFITPLPKRPPPSSGPISGLSQALSMNVALASVAVAASSLGTDISTVNVPGATVGVGEGNSVRPEGYVSTAEPEANLETIRRRGSASDRPGFNENLR
ncbi:unnamed protein product [Protopolystoma xenopodis]|uniref:EXS domain-containing protein n=1 Tax=Protopolystoma xenopodis TaxID=117903 RepID=A0A448X8H1_9PLAT|nr:unnamed protein product [Protopolystoma xenopodis]